MAFQFPKGFLFGAATAAHQVEGNNHNDWSEWELRNAGRLAAQAKQKAYLPAETHTPTNYISGRAVGHYHRYKEDLDIAAKLGLNCFRFSLEWSRICPEPGVYDKEAITHYREVIAYCHKRHLEPFVTLCHFTLPIWARDLGGWESKEVVAAFSEFAERMVREYGGAVTYWTIFNEPNVYVGTVYAPSPIVPTENKWLDYPAGWLHYLRARRNIVRAHRSAYKRIKEMIPTAQVGMTMNLIYYDKTNNNPLSRVSRWVHKTATNGYFFNRVSHTCDWLGMQYYQRLSVQGRRYHSDGRYPDGHREILRELWQRYHKPIYITESGVSDNQDQHRAKYIEESFTSIANAIELDGVDCRGYIHWALTDNFEWAEGFWRFFGLIRVDYRDPKLKRTIKKSAIAYTQMIKRYRR